MKENYLTFDKKTIDKIEKIIPFTNYEIEIIDCKIKAENCISIIEDLILEYETLLDEYNDYKAYIEDNYVFKEMK